MAGLSFVYNEAHRQQFDSDNRTRWDFGPAPNIKSDILPATAPTLLGYDVVCCSMQNVP
ncbi:hypothetical protein [Rhodopirellula sp. MGV]|uniref:hypothetical protein n=1 Tax=Rhodopirellula sp. MGV TaxID=2023130 RepID=UPI00130432FB|nr:hypothetical protein [Rhodopirellula sp. MGV]